jgi:hypothetical protein
MIRSSKGEYLFSHNVLMVGRSSPSVVIVLGVMTDNDEFTANALMPNLPINKFAFGG